MDARSSPPAPGLRVARGFTIACYGVRAVRRATGGGRTGRGRSAVRRIRPPAMTRHRHRHGPLPAGRRAPVGRDRGRAERRAARLGRRPCAGMRGRVSDLLPFLVAGAGRRVAVRAGRPRPRPHLPDVGRLQLRPRRDRRGRRLRLLHAARRARPALAGGGRGHPVLAFGLVGGPAPGAADPAPRRRPGRRSSSWPRSACCSAMQGLLTSSTARRPRLRPRSCPRAASPSSDVDDQRGPGHLRHHRHRGRPSASTLFLQRVAAWASRCGPSSTNPTLVALTGAEPARVRRPGLGSSARPSPPPSGHPARADPRARRRPARPSSSSRPSAPAPSAGSRACP